jgi:two-component sensor histidine kinase
MRVSPVQDSSGEVVRYIAIKHDITEERLAEEKLRQSLAEKTVLLQEVHHRVKNNLQIVLTLLSMQGDRMADDSRAAEPLKEAYSRVAAISLIHEQIYRAETLVDLDFSAYIRDLSTSLFDTYCVDVARIALDLNIEPIHLAMDAAVPFGLILSELISNSLKHAFRDRRNGVIRISLLRTECGFIELTVADNGVGLPVGFRMEESKSLGLQVVRTRTRQLRGALTPASDAGAGTTFTLRWKPEIA